MAGLALKNFLALRWHVDDLSCRITHQCRSRRLENVEFDLLDRFTGFDRGSGASSWWRAGPACSFVGRAEQVVSRRDNVLDFRTRQLLRRGQTDEHRLVRYSIPGDATFSQRSTIVAQASSWNSCRQLWSCLQVAITALA